MAKILLVEDDKSLREIYGVRLLAEGYDIVSAGDGEEALAMAIKERPQLIVSDVMMPKISGFDMLDILRSTSETKGIKVIMMTALSSEDQRLRGEQLGADRYLVKSQVGIEDVVRTVHEVLEDMPTPGTQQDPFGSAVPRSAPTAVAQPIPTPPVSEPTPASVAQQSAPTLAPTPQFSPTPQPAPAAAPTSNLPQPTAPFSTARPAGLADRIIQPIERPESTGEPLASLMDRELSQQQPAATPAPLAPPIPPVPAVPPQPITVNPVPELAPVPAPVPQQQTQVAPAPTPQFSPTPQPAPNPNPPTIITDPQVGFEETPRQ